jgi:hypothetical protein
LALSQAPGYFQKVKQPMCLDDMRAKLAAGAYAARGWPAFEADLNLIYDNAQLYNDAGGRGGEGSMLQCCCSLSNARCLFMGV